MPSPLEKLPQEILDELASYLSCSDIAKLVVGSKVLCQSFESSLYGPRATHHRNFAVYWACTKGNGGTIRRAVAYGASPTFFDTPEEILRIQKIRAQGVYKSRLKVPDAQQLTLYLAATNFRLDTFTTLLQLGAAIHHDGAQQSSTQCKNMMSTLGRHPERGFPFLQALFSAGLHQDIAARHSPAVALPLVAAVKARASPNVLEFLLAHGADVEQEIIDRDRVLSTSLSAAFRVGSRNNIEFLLSRGADIHGRHHSPPFGSASHVPVFAAASQINFLGPDILKLCLFKGADINQRVCVKGGGRCHCYHTTTLLHYLDSIKDSAFEEDTQLAISLEDGVTCLVEHGAAINPHMLPAPPRHPQLPRRWHISDTPSPVQLLLDKWGLGKLQQPRFLALVKRLIELGAAAGPATAHLISKYDADPEDYIDRYWDTFVAEWDGFVDLLFNAQPTKPCLDEMLTTLIVSRGTFEGRRVETLGTQGPRQSPVPDGESGGVGYFATSMFRRLLAEGADINCRIDGAPPAMHQLCAAWNAAAINAMPDLVQPEDDDGGDDVVLQRRRILLTMLVENGADPWILHDGKNAVEILTENLHRMLPRHKAHTLKYVAIIKREVREPAITPLPKRGCNCAMELLMMVERNQMGLIPLEGFQVNSGNGHQHA